MDYTTLLESQAQHFQIPLSSYLPPPLPPSYSTDPPPPSSYPVHYLSYPQNPNPSSPSLPQPSLPTHVATVQEPPLNPPGVDSYVPLNNSSNPNPITHLGHEAIPNLWYGHAQVVDQSSLVASSGYYFDPNAQNWAAREAIQQYGVDPLSYAAGISMASNGSEQLAIANPNATWWTNTTTQPHVNGTKKKWPKKVKTKIVQPAYCDVCKLECTSQEVLDTHKLGKKHKKNVEKLRESLIPTQVHPSGSSNPVIGPQLPDDKSKSNKNKKKKRGTPEDLERKKHKVLEGGAAAEAVRICAICNVVCNSDTVYNYHLAGQKHIAMVKKASSHT